MTHKVANRKLESLGLEPLGFFRGTYLLRDKHCAVREAGADSQKDFFRCNKEVYWVQLRSPRRKYGIRNHHRMMMIIFISDMKCIDIHRILISDSTPLSRILSIIVGGTIIILFKIWSLVIGVGAAQEVNTIWASNKTDSGLVGLRGRLRPFFENDQND